MTKEENKIADNITLEEVIETLQTWIATADDEYDREEMGRVCGLKEALHEIKKIKPCTDAISRQSVKEQMIKYGFHAPDMTITEFVEDLPPITPSPKMGRWIKSYEEYIPYLYCSNCEFETGATDYMKYCPNCGAKMVNSQESGVNNG